MSSLAYSLNHLEILEAEAIHILREVAAQFERPALLYSAGKDSTVLVRLAEKAFYPGKIPFKLMHVDTGFDFPEMYEFRDALVKRTGTELVVYRNEAAISEGANPFDLGTQRCCALLRTQALVDAIRTNNFDAAIGGGRREEERSRAKERVFSVRDRFGQWDPKNQRPELWSIYNGKVQSGESIRVFPLSNWTELDIWHYIHVEQVDIVPLYFAKKRKMVVRGAQLIPILPAMGKSTLLPGEEPQEIMCRFRTLGCTPCTGAIYSNATTVAEIVQEMLEADVSERATRIIDHDTDGSMELKKREGYF